MMFSIIIPLFNRLDELNECLKSLSNQTYKDFELILVDGSPVDILSELINNYKNKISDITHIHIPYYPISESRNLGCQKAKGDFFIFFDSDCIIPPAYLNNVNKAITQNRLDAFGGPDAADSSFTDTQKAINYTMTSFFTTGGIRGKEKHLGTYHPRGFNMGFSKEVFNKTNGFSTLKVSEDIDLSIRIIEAGFKVSLIPEAFVYHKRRTNFRKFFKQVYRFGAGRIYLFRLHPKDFKITYVFPFAFQCFLFILLLSALCSLLTVHCLLLFILLSSLLILYLLLLLADSTFKNKNLYIGLLSVLAALIQLNGYGSGFIINFIKVFILRKKEGIINK